MVLTEKLKRPKALAAAFLLLFASLVPILSRENVSAYELVADRAIKMSSSAGGAADVTYEVSFEAATTGNLRGLVIDFCSDSPILNDTCTAPVGFDANTAGLALANQSGVTDFAVNNAGTADDTNTIVLSSATGSVTGGTTVVSFELGGAGGSDGITNPTATNTTFYARIVTYAVATEAQTYLSTNIDNGGTAIDAGGVALSTAQQITVTSKVQEQLDFCMYYAAAATLDSCSTVPGANAFALGDTNGVLSTDGVFVDIGTRYNVRTNAQTGVAIRMTGTTLTHPSSYTISANNTANGAQAATNAEQFGICTYMDPSSNNPGLVAVDGYDGDGTAGVTDTACAGATQSSGTGSTGGDNSAYFKFDDSTTLDQGTNHLYGSHIATKAAGDWSAGVIATAAGAAYTTEAGIYTTTLTFIATGTY